MGTRVTYEVADSVATVTMDDGKVNALGFDMLAELNEAFDRAEAENVGLILAGRSGIFSAGFDLAVMKSAEMPRLLKAGFELSYRMLSFRLPVVLACTGHTFAMGLFVTLSADYRIGVAGAEHKIVANEVAIGMTMPQSAIALCHHRLTDAYIDRVVGQAELFNPDSAVEAGLLDEVVPSDVHLERVREKAVQLKNLDPAAFAGTKRRLHEKTLASLRAAIEADDAELGPSA
jgi:enoyl-CoA hydratase